MPVIHPACLVSKYGNCVNDGAAADGSVSGGRGGDASDGSVSGGRGGDAADGSVSGGRGGDAGEVKDPVLPTEFQLFV